MAIFYDANSKTFHLKSAGSSYVIRISKGNYLMHVYYGGLIHDDAALTLPPLQHASHSPDSASGGFTLDAARLEYPCEGSGDMRESAFTIRGWDGSIVTDLRYASHQIVAGKPGLPGLPATYVENDVEADTLIITMRDDYSGVEADLYYTAFRDYAAITRHTVVRNCADKAVDIERVMSACIDLPSMDYDRIDLYGTWAMERTPQRTPLAHGLQGIHSKRGSSGHMYNPFMALAAKEATEFHGDVYGMSLVYSSNFLMEVECDKHGTSRFLAGINPADFGWHLEPGESFCSPELVMTYSPEGIGGMSRVFHRLYRYRLCRGPWKTAKRPILVNNWEATYFDFNTDKLVDIAKDAADLGIEMLVMDDGWFGLRNDDTTSLGDWFVNEDKLPGGLGKLVEQINALGLKFGIWFEPEMISPVSKLYEAHPEWCLKVDGREMSIGRNQYVLDMSRQDVRDYLFDTISGILHSANICYVKWDFNRNLTEAGSLLLPPERQKEIFHRYVLGTYELMERLLTEFPDLLLEGCAGGGGRFDPGMLYYSPQFWTSDDTDAIERLTIQYGTSMVYPPSAMSAHVSACPNHGTGRTTPFKTRGDVAMAGAFGYELDLTQLTAEEKDLVRQQVQNYHELAEVVQDGDYYRLSDPTKDNIVAWEYVSRDKSVALVTAVAKLNNSYLPNQKILKLHGLDLDAVYEDAEHGITLHGDTLERFGLDISSQWRDFESRVWKFVRR